jgi:hypothetical protein
MEYGGAHARQSDLFGTQDAVVKITKTFFKVSMLVKTVCLFYCNKSFDFHCCMFLLLNIYLSFSECIAHYSVKNVEEQARLLFCINVGMIMWNMDV